MKPSSDERGIALALALFALTVIAALVGSSFLAARLEQQSGRNTVFSAQAREAAEAGLSEAVSTLEASALSALVAGDAPQSLESLTLGSGVSASRDVSRLTTGLFLIRARGLRRSANGMILATRSLGALVQLVPATAFDTASGASASGPRLAERGWFQLY